MSLLTNLSSASMVLRKPDKENTIPVRDCSVSVVEADGVEMGDDTFADADESPVQPTGGSARPKTKYKIPRKPRPMPVIQVDPLEFIEPDEYGAELGKEARVWKVYTKETNQWDAELVDGWNKCDPGVCCIIFGHLDHTRAATRFLIESSKLLKEDPSDVSAAALVTISQTLLALTNSSSAGTPASDTDSNAATGFVPPRHAVIVNVLWYLSLSLSVATSLLAMLAKEWCHSFATNRTGHPCDQALRRQRKWMMIEKWKMQEFIAVLPTLIHVSLSLFAIGLCVYVWDLNSTVAIPIIVITSIAFAFYIWSSLMASLVQLFPYTTIVSRVLRSDFAQPQINVLKNQTTKLLQISLWVANCLNLCIRTIVFLIPPLILSPLLVFECCYLPCFLLMAIIANAFCLDVSYSDNPFRFYSAPLSWINALLKKGARKLNRTNILGFMGTAISYLGFKSTQPHWDQQDRVKSLALKWLIQNCETPISISIALQAIAGASSRIPKKPLEECEATLHILRRLAQSSTSAAHGEESDNSLYTRALAVLGSHTQENQDITKNGGVENIEVLLRDFQAEHERQVGELISDRSLKFQASEDNLKALLLGNAATDFALRLLKGEDQGVTETLDSVISLLLNHIWSGNQKLDTAASHSLANAAVVLTTCSQGSILSREIVQQQLQRLISSFPTDKAPVSSQSNNVSHSEIALLACILLSGAPEPQATADELQFIMTSRTEKAIRTLMDDCWKTPSSVFSRVGMLEVIFNPSRYGITWKTDDVQTKIGKNYWESGLLLSQYDRNRKSKNRDASNVNAEVTEFLAATERVYNLVAPLTPQIQIAITLPIPTYYTLVHIAYGTQLADQRAQCEQLLSRSVFPKLGCFSMASVPEFTDRLWYHYFEGRLPSDSEAGSSTKFLSGRPWWRDIDSRSKAQSRHVAATQLWLLFHLAEHGRSLSQQQQDLKLTLDRGAGEHSGSSIPSKLQLEEEILQAYKERNHLGIYSARIIECIFQSRGPKSMSESEKREYDQVSERIAKDLQRVPPCLRGLSSLSDPPTGRADSPHLTHTTTSPFPFVQTEPGPITPMSLVNTNHVAIPIRPGD